MVCNGRCPQFLGSSLLDKSLRSFLIHTILTGKKTFLDRYRPQVHITNLGSWNSSVPFKVQKVPFSSFLIEFTWRQHTFFAFLENGPKKCEHGFDSLCMIKPMLYREPRRMSACLIKFATSYSSFYFQCFQSTEMLHIHVSPNVCKAGSCDLSEFHNIEKNYIIFVHFFSGD